MSLVQCHSIDMLSNIYLEEKYVFLPNHFVRNGTSFVFRVSSATTTTTTTMRVNEMDVT